MSTVKPEGNGIIVLFVCTLMTDLKNRKEEICIYNNDNNDKSHLYCAFYSVQSHFTNCPNSTLHFIFHIFSIATFFKTLKSVKLYFHSHINDVLTRLEQLSARLRSQRCDVRRTRRTWPPLTRKLVHTHLMCTVLHAFLVRVPPELHARSRAVPRPCARTTGGRWRLMKGVPHISPCATFPQMETLITLPPPLPHALPSPPSSCCHIHTHHILSAKLQCWPVIYY